MSSTTSSTVTTTTQAAALTPGTIALIVGAVLIVVLLLLLLMRRGRSRVEQTGVADTPPVAQVPPMAPLAEPVIDPAPPIEVDPVTPDEVVAAQPAAEPMAVEAVAPEPEPVVIEGLPVAPTPTAAPGEDELTRMKGVGPKLAAQLAALGYTRFEQIATLTPEQAEALDAQLGSFRGRLHRDRWIEQAGYLARGDVAGFESAFGRL